MNAIETLKLTGGALIVVASINAWSQTSDSATTSGQSAAASSSEGSSKAAIRKANRALSKKVLQSLAKGGVETSGINVIAKGGAVTLVGHVSTSTEIAKASAVAKTVTGVTSVKNALTIDEGGGQ
jgi:hyperosmotically inducible periplasmic protein